MDRIVRKPIDIKKIGEAGYMPALTGLTLSWHDPLEPHMPLSRAEEVALRLAHRDGGGDNKFLESVITWWYIRAPRYWWCEADTYRLTTKQSESTMHIIKRRHLTHDDFLSDTSSDLIENINKLIELNKSVSVIKSNLPEGYLQARVWMISYKVLRNIILQRRDHKLLEWKLFCTSVLRQVDKPEWLPSEKE